MYLRSTGVILKKSNFAEADRILTVYTKDFGKITCLAKGVRRPKSKKAGHVELGNWCKIFVARGKNLDLLSEVEVKKAFGIDNFSTIRANQIYHLLELVDTLTAHHQKNVPVYKLLVTYLNNIAKGEDFPQLSLVFKVKLLSALGFFSAQSLRESKTKDLFVYLEESDLSQTKSKLNLSPKSYLKLSAFLDSMIEKVSETKIKTTRFLYG